jgi:hypothetical protein
MSQKIQQNLALSNYLHKCEELTLRQRNLSQETLNFNDNSLLEDCRESCMTLKRELHQIQEQLFLIRMQKTKTLSAFLWKILFKVKVFFLSKAEKNRLYSVCDSPWFVLFDAEWYQMQNPELRIFDIDPWLHYCLYGSKRGRNPNAFFDATWYLKYYPDVLSSGMDPLEHYWLHGSKESRNPSIFFDSAWYIKAYPDVLSAGMNSLHHYLEYGRKEGRRIRGIIDFTK